MQYKVRRKKLPYNLALFLTINFLRKVGEIYYEK